VDEVFVVGEDFDVGEGSAEYDGFAMGEALAENEGFAVGDCN